uniref:Uncharacterized protein n=2 Tax=Caenorhabditis japonica TaxID=281687 RepID=A0A8R1IS39_CAEJA
MSTQMFFLSLESALEVRERYWYFSGCSSSSFVYLEYCIILQATIWLFAKN